MALRKLTKREKKTIVGVSAIIVGVYMILILKNNRGIVPGLLGVGVLLQEYG